MTETWETDAILTAKSGTTVASGIFYMTQNEDPWFVSLMKMITRFEDVTALTAQLRVYKDGDLTFGVTAGRFLNGDAAVSYSAAAAQALTDDATNYIYLTAAGALTVNTTGFPTPSVTPHVPLATIATGSASDAGVSGEYNRIDIVDYRGHASFALPEAGVSITVYNGTGITINAGQLLHVVGYDAGNAALEVELADADTSGKPTHLIANESINNAATGAAVQAYTLTAQNTSAGSVGDPVYLSATAGGWTLTAPTGADQIAQVVGFVTVSHATTGEILFRSDVLISPDVTGTSGLQDDSVSLAKLAAITQGSIIVGGAANAPTALDAKTDAQILIGDGTDLASVAVSGDVSITNAGVASLTHTSLMAMHTHGDWAIDGDGDNGGLVGPEVTNTETANTHAVVYDHGTTTYAQLASSSSLTGWAANYQIAANAGSEAVNDAFYIGNAVPFSELYLDMDTAASYTGDQWTWEYWDGAAWSTLTLVQDYTDSTALDGARTGQRDGATHFIPPSDWAETTVNSTECYWIRARVTTAGNAATAGDLDGVNPKIVTPADGFVALAAGTIDKLRVVDHAATLHTANDIKFILMNFTTGAHSGELTFAQDKALDKWTISGGLTVAADDVLGILITQEDGTNEAANVDIELEYTRT